MPGAEGGRMPGAEGWAEQPELLTHRCGEDQQQDDAVFDEDKVQRKPESHELQLFRIVQKRNILFDDGFETAGTEDVGRVGTENVIDETGFVGFGMFLCEFPVRRHHVKINHV